MRLCGLNCPLSSPADKGANIAVYTHIEDRDLREFLKRYDIGDLQGFSGIAEGVENSNYLLRTDRASYILTLYEKRVEVDDLPFFIGLMEHLSAAGLNCPVPIKDKSGEILQKLCDKPAAIVSYLEGVSGAYPNATKCHALGEALAQFHLRSEGFAGARENALGPEGWASLLASIQNQIEDKPKGMPEHIVENAAAQYARLLAHWPACLPHGYIHADLFPNNVLFVGDRLTGLIDFYFACQDMYSYDLAICLNSWCFDLEGEFDSAKSSALLKGYQKHRLLTEAEKTALPLLCQGAALRFFLTRLYDWYNTPAEALVKPLDPMEFWTRLEFWAIPASMHRRDFDMMVGN